MAFAKQKLPFFGIFGKFCEAKLPVSGRQKPQIRD